MTILIYIVSIICTQYVDAFETRNFKLTNFKKYLERVMGLEGLDTHIRIKAPCSDALAYCLEKL